MAAPPPFAAPPAGRHLSALRGIGIPADRLHRLADGMGLPAWNGPATDGGVAANPQAAAVAILFQDAEAIQADELWAWPFAAWVDVTALDDGQIAAVLARAASGDAFASVRTAAVNDLNLARWMAGIIARRASLPVARAGDIEFALHEAISNAVLHGNLQMEGMKALNLSELERFSHDLSARLNDPALAGRRIEVTLRIDGGTAIVEVGDEGRGFTPSMGAQPSRAAAEPLERRKASGRGLDLIAAIADSLELLDGGRRIRMGFVL